MCPSPPHCSRETVCGGTYESLTALKLHIWSPEGCSSSDIKAAQCTFIYDWERRLQECTVCRLLLKKLLLLLLVISAFHGTFMGQIY